MTKTKKTDSSTKLILDVQPRTVFGKKLRKLRYTGVVPANIYGPDFKSMSIQVVFKELTHAYRTAKETGIVYLKTDKEEIPALIKLVQRHPVTDTILHVDFRKIDLKKKIQTEVPVVAVGTSEAVSQKGGVLLNLTTTLLVEALPEDIPQHIKIDISSIKEIAQEIKVSDLPKSPKYEIKTVAEKVLISVVAHKEESVTPETTTVAPEVITEAVKPEDAATEGVVAPETGKKPEAATPVEKKQEAKK
ncbi:MAG: 50S ribosomal protein L25 [bacterium]|nr:50S ribosomal protein L25 [bacterium]